MDFRDDEEEDRYVRRIARPMAVSPDRLTGLLQPLGFILVYANRREGINQINFFRPAPLFDGLFDVVEIKSNITGVGADLQIGMSVVSRFDGLGVSEFVDATRYGYARDSADFHHSHAGQARMFEKRLAAAMPDLFAEFHGRNGEELLAKTASMCSGAERYLRRLQPSDDLHETLARLRRSATPEQLAKAEHYVKHEFVESFNLEDFRVVSDIAALCQVLYWEFPDRPYRGFRGEISWKFASADDLEAHGRYTLVASRLAREPGWPAVDPLVPSRHDKEEGVPWRDGKPSNVAELFEEYLSSSNRRCICGKTLFYLNHVVRKGSTPKAEIVIRCNSGHEQRIEMPANLAAFR